MKKTTGFWSLFCGVLLCLALAERAAVAQFHGGGCACGRYQLSHPTWEIDHNTANFQNAAAAEFTKWHDRVDRWAWTVGDNFAGANSKNEILFFTVAQTFSQYGILIDSDVFGVAYLNPMSAFGAFNACPPPAGTTCGTFTETDVIMNFDFSRGWTTALPNYSDTGPANYAATALHELGHTLGLHHNFGNLSTMNYFEDFAGRYLTVADAAIARLHYPSNLVTTTDMATYPFRYSGAGDGYTSTNVASVSPSTVAAGSTFTLHNFTVENPGSVNLSNVVLSIYLSTDSTITSSDHLVGTLGWATFSALGWWDTSSGWTFTLPGSVPAGTYYIGAIVTYNNTAADGVTYNNSWVLDDSRRLTVTPAGGSCVQDFTLACGDTDFWSNNGTGSTNAVSTYSCDPELSQSGPEYTYIFEPATDTDVQLDLTGLSADLDLFVLRDFGTGCIPGNCISSSVAASNANDQIRFGAVGGRRYYVVVDGYLGATSNYTIQLTCQGATFADLPPGNWATPYILAIYNAGITTGCSASPRNYCPNALVTREQMAVFLERGLRGGSFVPPPAVGIFSDVPAGSWSAPWIEQLYSDGVTAGCATSPLRYCPGATVTRDSMAIFLLRAKHGASYTPPPAVGIFSDVPASYWAAPWIEQLYAEGITSGCATSPLRYCPGNGVTRAEMAVFLSRAFNLPVP